MEALARRPVSLEWAAAKATARCMARSGFEFPEYAVFRPTTGTVGSLGGMGSPLTAQAARTAGYGERVSSSDAGDPDTATRAYLATLSGPRRRGYSRALEDPAAPQVEIRLPDGARFGASSRGCIAEGRSRVYGSVRNALMLYYFPQQVNRFAEDAFGDPSSRRGLSTYSRCMGAEGYDVKGPSDALHLAERRFGAARRARGSPSDEERAMAVIDATCQSRSLLYPTLHEALVRAASGWLNDHDEEILALSEVERASLVRAGEILRST